MLALGIEYRFPEAVENRTSQAEPQTNIQIASTFNKTFDDIQVLLENRPIQCGGLLPATL